VLETKHGDLQRQLADTNQAIETTTAKYALETREFAAGNTKADPGAALAQKDFLEHKRHGLDQLLASTTAELEPLVQQRARLAERLERQAEQEELEQRQAALANAERNCETKKKEYDEAYRLVQTAHQALGSYQHKLMREQIQRERGQR